MVLEKKIFQLRQCLSLFCSYFPLEKSRTLHLNKHESPLPWNALCKVWLKLTQWFWQDFYAPEIEDRDAYCFCPVCHFVILFSSLKHSSDTFIFETVTLTLEFDPFFEKCNLSNNFWTVSARALIFHTSISCDQTFQWVPTFFTPWPWPWSLIYILETLILLIIFEQWVLELCYFTWLILVIIAFSGYQRYWPVTLEYVLLFENSTLLITFQQRVP